MLPRFDGRHLLEQIFADDESHGCQEADDADLEAELARERIVVVQTIVFLGGLIDSPALR